jgi:hypothetical protein
MTRAEYTRTGPGGVKRACAFELVNLLCGGRRRSWGASMFRWNLLSEASDV